MTLPSVVDSGLFSKLARSTSNVRSGEAAVERWLALPEAVRDSVPDSPEKRWLDAAAAMSGAGMGIIPWNDGDIPVDAFKSVIEAASKTPERKNLVPDDGVPHDAAEAEASGDTLAMTSLGRAYMTGGGGRPVNAWAALKLFMFAANLGDTLAMVLAGRCYERGTDTVEPDEKMALEWYRRAMEAGDIEGKRAYRMLRRSMVDRSADWVSPYVGKPDKKKPRQQGEKSHSGDPLWSDLDDIEDDFDPMEAPAGLDPYPGAPGKYMSPKKYAVILGRARKGDPESQVEVGLHLAYGRLFSGRRYDRAMEWWRAAYAQSPRARYYIGWCYDYGLGIDCQPYSAQKLYESAREFAPAAVALKRIKWCLNREPSDYYRVRAADRRAEWSPSKTDVSWAPPSKQTGNVAKASDDASDADGGQAAADESHTATAADAGHIETKSPGTVGALQGASVADEGGIPADDAARGDTARNDILSPPREAPQPDAVLDGLAYLYGIGASKDERKAYMCFRNAADAGNREAGFYLAACFASGVGVKANPQMAVKWSDWATGGDANERARLEREASDKVLAIRGTDYAPGNPSDWRGPRGSRSSRIPESAAPEIAVKGRSGGSQPKVPVNDGAVDWSVIRRYNADVEYCESKAKAGDMRALVCLGGHYLFGPRGTLDPSKGWRMMKLAIKSGDMFPPYYVGSAVDHGLIPWMPKSNIVPLFRMAAARGFARAAQRLNEMGLEAPPVGASWSFDLDIPDGAAPD